MTNIFARFMKDESGATAIEYGLIAALISVAIISGAGVVGTQLGTLFTNIGTKMTAAKTTSGQ
ncbi:Flp family type IVb pilin [Agrobacterium rosae]|uniref:Flp family type IVb pilin n=1 Tax=Agrobacterium rosae TaxID=1972867 RepID=UPI003A80314B